MSTGFLMIVLTLLEGGQMSAAFVNTASLSQCKARAAAVGSILKENGSAFEKLVCRRSEARFEPFVHGMPADAPRWTYFVAMDDETATVEAVGSCESGDGEGRYCVSSTQEQIRTQQQ